MAEQKKDRDVEHSVPVGEMEDNDAITSFTALNDFCCLMILDLLPLFDLYAMGQTCTRLEALSAKVFCRRHPDKAIGIKSISDEGKVEHMFHEKYAKCFAKFIPNVTLSLGQDPNETLIRLCKMYEENGCPIKTIQFKNWEAKLDRSHGVTIGGIVDDIESVMFTGMEIDGDLYENMLQFMPNMKHLTFYKRFKESDGIDMNWMEKTYPKLESFAWHAIGPTFPVAKLKLLFKGNPTIKHFSLLATSIETIQQVKDEGIHVDELFIDFDGFNHMKREYPESLDCLQVLCNRHPGLRLHMKCNDQLRYYFCQRLDELAPLSAHIEGLYFESIEAIDGIAYTGSGLWHFIFNCTLKVFQALFDVTFDWSQLSPKLEKLFSFYKNYNVALADVAAETLSQRRRRRRMKMRNGHKLKIYISSLEASSTIDKLNESDIDLVEVIRTETEIVNNPLVFMKERRIRRKGPRVPLDELDRAILRLIYS